MHCSIPALKEHNFTVHSGGGASFSPLHWLGKWGGGGRLAEHPQLDSSLFQPQLLVCCPGFWSRFARYQLVTKMRPTIGASAANQINCSNTLFLFARGSTQCVSSARLSHHRCVCARALLSWGWVGVRNAFASPPPPVSGLGSSTGPVLSIRSGGRWSGESAWLYAPHWKVSDGTLFAGVGSSAAMSTAGNRALSGRTLLVLLHRNDHLQECSDFLVLLLFLHRINCEFVREITRRVSTTCRKKSSRNTSRRF